MAVLLDGASRLQAKLVPRESIGGEALYVQDPLDAENNVARSCFAFHQVQQVFRDLCEPSPAPTLTLPYNFLTLAFHQVPQVFRDALARLEASLGVAGPAAAAEVQPELDLLGRLLDTQAAH